MRLLSESRKAAICLWLVDRAPRWYVKWCALRLIAYATSGRYGNTDPAELDVMEALRRWDGR